jgi:hypothetical protein
MDQPVRCTRPWEHARRVGRWGLPVLLAILGFTLVAHECVVAAEPPDSGGTVIWAVHEGMPHSTSTLRAPISSRSPLDRSTIAS